MELITFYKLERRFLILLILFLSLHSYSQKITNFSNDNEVFLEELDTYLGYSQNDEIKQISKQISKTFKKGLISESDKKRIRDISDLMLGAKMNPSPYFRDFLQVVLLLSNNLTYKNKLTDWLIVSKNILLNSNSRKLLKFCEFSNSFITNQTLRNTKTINWRVETSSFSFKDELGTPFIDFYKEF